MSTSRKLEGQFCDEYKKKFGKNVELLPYNSTLCIEVNNDTCSIHKNNFEVALAIVISIMILFLFLLGLYLVFACLSHICTFFLHMKQKYQRYCDHKLTVQKDCAMFDYV